MRFVGDLMKEFRQPLMTIFIIFATAYVLSLIGCAPLGDKTVGPSAPVSDKSRGAPAPVITPPTDGSTVELKLVDPAKMPQCTDQQFAALKSWATAVTSAEDAIKVLGIPWKEKSDVKQLALTAIVQCDRLQQYHSVNPCKKLTGQNIVNPNGVVKAYDGARINKRCEIPHQYLVKFNSRPDPLAAVVPRPAPASVQPPLVVNPPTPVPLATPVVVANPNSPTELEARDMHECNDNEFTKLKSLRAVLDQANKNIAKIGGESSWKYEPNSIDAATSATQLCESAISYHDSSPCKRFIKNDTTHTTDLKVYSGSSLRQQCQVARKYNYEFAQKSSSLIMPNAKLMFDTSIISGVAITPLYSAEKTFGQCVISNTSQSNTVTYGGQKVLVTEARVYPTNGVEGYQMFVMSTAEGVKLECYGLNYTSAKTSKNEVVRLLKEKQTSLSLSYELN